MEILTASFKQYGAKSLYTQIIYKTLLQPIALKFEPSLAQMSIEEIARKRGGKRNSLDKSFTSLDKSITSVKWLNNFP